MRLISLPTKEINLKDDLFRLSPVVKFQTLLPSIKQVGLISPPYLKKSKEGYTLVSGWKRILASRRLGCKEISAFLAPQEASDLDLFLICLEDNLSCRALSLAEKAEAAAKLVRFGLTEEKIVAEYLPRFLVPTRRFHLELLLKVAEQGELRLKKFLHENDLSWEALEILLTFSPPERELILPYLQAVSFSQRREIILYLHEISVRDKMTIAAIWQQEEMAKILGSEKYPLRQKAVELAGWLKKRRYPLLSSWEEEFQKVLRDISWPEEVRLSYDRTFERDLFTVSFSFRQAEELAARLRQLEEVTKRAGFHRLFRRML